MRRWPRQAAKLGPPSVESVSRKARKTQVQYWKSCASVTSATSNCYSPHTPPHLHLNSIQLIPNSPQKRHVALSGRCHGLCRVPAATHAGSSRQPHGRLPGHVRRALHTLLDGAHTGSVRHATVQQDAQPASAGGTGDALTTATHRTGVSWHGVNYQELLVTQLTNYVITKERERQRGRKWPSNCENLSNLKILNILRIFKNNTQTLTYINI